MSIGKEDQGYTLSVSRSKKKKITPEDAASELNDSVSSVSSGDFFFLGGIFSKKQHISS